MILFYHLSCSEGPRELFGDLDIKFGKENIGDGFKETLQC